jgi:hypothetical protein
MRLKALLEYFEDCDLDSEVVIREMSDLYEVHFIAIQEKMGKVILNIKISGKEEDDDEYLH